MIAIPISQIPSVIEECVQTGVKGAVILSAYTRREARSLVENLGGRATSSVSGQTDYVAAGRGAGGKLDEARSSDAEIIGEKAFEKMLKGT